MIPTFRLLGRLSLGTLAFVLLVISSVAGQPQQQTATNPTQNAQAPGSLHGSVVRNGTLEPLRDVEVSIGSAANLGMLPMLQAFLEQAKTEDDSQRAARITKEIEVIQAAAKGPKPVLTNNDGQFTVDGIPPGRHVVTARRRGYFSTNSLPEGIASPNVSISVTIISDQTTEITMSMSPGAAVSGRVLTANAG